MERLRQPWHRARPALLAQVGADVGAFCNTLHVFIEGEVVRVRGTFPVSHNGAELNRYAILIEFPKDYPDELPIVREVGGRIPWLADRHVFPRTGVCCVLLPEDRWWSFPPGTPFAEYLRGPLHNYFLAQSVVAAGGKWPFGEHKHGFPGITDFYEAKFGAKNSTLVVRFLQLVCEGGVRGHMQCACGSGRTLRKCHPGVIEVAKRMPRWAAQQSFENLVRLVRSARAATQSPSGQDTTSA